jgi:mobilome CxxCx(11)CxxC protein
MRIVDVLGIITPVLFGSLLLQFNFSEGITNGIKIVAGIFAIIQLIFSSFALIEKWSESLAYSIESSNAHNRLYQKYNNLLLSHTQTLEEIKNQYDKLEIERIARDEQDAKMPPSDVYLRKGFRYALKIQPFPCPTCKLVPADNVKSNCDTCKDIPFKNKLNQWLHS